MSMCVLINIEYANIPCVELIFMMDFSSRSHDPPLPLLVPDGSWILVVVKVDVRLQCPPVV